MGSCATAKKPFNPHRKFSPDELKQDFDLYRNILEERHPSLYWYTPKPIMDEAFLTARLQLTDSLTELEFRKLLMRVNSLIQCGHTSIKASKKYAKYQDTVKAKASFPLAIKTWNDTAVIVSNAYKPDSALVRGVHLVAINGCSIKAILDTLRLYISADGGNRVAKDQLISNAGWWGPFYTAVFGQRPPYEITYQDANGAIKNTTLQALTLRQDTLSAPKKPEKKTKKQRLEAARSLKIDPTQAVAVMQLNSFSNRLQLGRFFRTSFREMKAHQVQHLILDLRSNGGGRVTYSTLLTRFIAAEPFKLADSLYAKTGKSHYSRYIKNDFWMKLILAISTRKKTSEQLHYSYFEKHKFTPLRKNHFDGQVFILSGGATYSASTLVMAVLRPQHNVILVGEPSGGTAYGNTAWLIPDVTLPHTNVRFRLPLFRLVMDKNRPKDGQGVLPEVWATPTIEAIKKGEDYKMKRARELIADK